MKLFPGKLYKINEYFWLLFPTKEAAAAAAATWASHWSQHLSCDVTLLSAGDAVMIVDVCEVYVKVINREGRGGWVNLPIGEDWIENIFTGGMTGNGT